VPLSEGAASAIVGGINAVGSYFATKGIAKEAKKTEAAKRRLIDLQAEEQRIRNQAAQMSLSDQNARLPFTVSGPSLPSDAFDGGVRPAGLPAAAAAPGPSQLAGSGGLLLVGAAVVIGGLMLTKARAV